MLSCLWICRGDQPFAEEEMIESRAARDAEGPLPDRLSLAVEELDAGGDMGAVPPGGGMLLVDAESGVSTANGIVPVILCSLRCAELAEKIDVYKQDREECLLPSPFGAGPG